MKSKNAAGLLRLVSEIIKYAYEEEIFPVDWQLNAIAKYVKEKGTERQKKKQNYSGLKFTDQNLKSVVR